MQPEGLRLHGGEPRLGEEEIAKYPAGRQASAVIPLLWRAQEQKGGWLPSRRSRVAEMLGMAHIRVLEVATFYTMFLLEPVGRRPTCRSAARRPACCAVRKGSMSASAHPS